MKGGLKRLVAAFAIMLLSGAGIAVAPSSAYAAAQPTCSDYQCDGKDPERTLCSAGASTIMTMYYAGGLLELRWGPPCKTNWARFRAADNAEYYVYIMRLSDHVKAGDGLNDPLRLVNNKGNTAYTDQVYSPGPAAACVWSPQLAVQSCLTQTQ